MSNIPKGYKQTEVGVIPEDWEVTQLIAIADVRDGTHESPKYTKTGVPFVTSKNILAGRVDFEDITFISEDDAKAVNKRSKVDVNDILLSMIGTVGNAALVDFDPEFCIKNVALIKPLASQIESRFLIQVIRSDNYGSYIDNKLDGGIQKFISLGMLRGLEVPMPPTKAEQEAIAGALSDADALIESLDRLIAKKRDLKQGAMQALLTGKRRLPGFSGEWAVKTLGDIADTDPENLGSDTHPNYTFNYIALEDVDVGTLRSYSEQAFRTAPSRARRKLRKNDVLVSTVRPNLMSHMLFHEDGDRWVCSTGFCVVRCRAGVSHPGYIFFHMFANGVSRQIDALLTGSNYPAINSGDVRALQIPIPEYEEQAAIAEVLADMDAEIVVLEQRRDKARLVKQGMMQELLTGRIRLI